ncbi:MAG TPA: hypothetical protein VFV38_19530 [Ktedonobacteraceae bacterium]|nr:hypothetical protein [Ktedonobacteraceae bacterium]
MGTRDKAFVSGMRGAERVAAAVVVVDVASKHEVWRVKGHAFGANVVAWSPMVV